jgi:hypothetical protein
MASKLGSDEITMVFYDPIDSTSYAVIWDSASQTWGNQITLSTDMSLGNVIGESVGVAYETDSGASVVFSGDGLDSIAHARWTGSSWSSVSTSDPEPSALLNDLAFVRVKADPGSDKIMICQTGTLLTCAEYDSGSLGSWTDPGPQPVSLVSRTFDFAWDPSGSTGILVSEAGLTSDYAFSTWTGSSWQAGSVIPANTGHMWIQGATNPFENDSVNSIFIGSNVLNELEDLVYDGSDLDLSSGSLSISQLGSLLYEGASIDFGRDLSSLPSSYAASISENIPLSDNISRQASRQSAVSELVGIIDDLLWALATGGTASESIAISDSITVVKTSGGGSEGGSESPESGGSGGGNGRRQDPRDTTPPSASAVPPAGVYKSIQTVTLSADEPSTFYYTVDGSDPAQSGLVYSGPIVVAQNTTLKFFAKDGSGNSGPIITVVYSFSALESLNHRMNPSGQPSTDGPAEKSGSMDVGPATDAGSDIPEIQDTSSGVRRTLSSGIASNILANETGNESAWNVGMIVAAVLVPAAILPSTVLHNSRRKEVLVDGVLIDGNSIRELFRGEDHYKTFARLLDLQHEVSWVTGLKTEDIRIVLDSELAISLGLVSCKWNESKSLKVEVGSPSERQKDASIVICSGEELTIEAIRNALESKILLEKQKWFVLTADKSYSYSKDRLEELLSNLPKDAYRDRRMFSLLETLTHLEFLLDYSDNSKILITREGELFYHDRYFKNIRFSKYGKGRAVSRKQWIERELLDSGVRLTEEGARLMSLDEKRELLISTAIEKQLWLDPASQHDYPSRSTQS